MKAEQGGEGRGESARKLNDFPDPGKKTEQESVPGHWRIRPKLADSKPRLCPLPRPGETTSFHNKEAEKEKGFPS